MSRTVAIQMDPIASIDIKGDSTFVMGLEAQARGYDLLHYHPDDMFYDRGRIKAEVRPMKLRYEKGNHYDLGDAKIIDLAKETDVILMRQDPPFDMNYITATHLLEAVHPESFVVNHPGHVRNAPEKIFVTEFPDLMPPTLITRSAARIRDFREEFKDIIVKPLFGNGGAGVFHLKPGDENLNSLLELFAVQSREPLMVQAYLPDVRKGDKRIILVDGKPVGAINRVPAEGEARSNMHVGGVAEKSMLTPREIEICERIGPELKKRDLIFVGIDVIGDYMTEINVTSPTGLQEVNRFDGSKLESLIWDAIETRIS
ncbi:glutathione synthetase [Thalassospira lucentensis]|uniref:Glutathione synthetase n=1 Tax=Thalassospira lucentensis TaxID=168935 RepID=A0A154L7U2_9PROT|nr:MULTISPECIES: glutathione synthase [Thalassospira]KZB66740.1 glutathione synthetase [Thalassospira lucentensis]MCH2273372.1 glutathione synthase [Thalassospira sp.]